MQLLRTAKVAIAIGVAVVATAADVSAESLGRAPMPSTVAQYFGYGYGAGRHAPLVRTPGMHGPHVPRNVRVPRCVGPLYPAPYAPVRCYGEACYGAEPTAVPEPAASQEILPAPAAAPVPDRHVWRRNF